MKRTVLVVEDNYDVRENTIELLELHGYKTFAAVNGSIGFEFARKKRPDVIICDITMPDTNGLEMLKLLKGNQHTKEIPLIFFSAGSAPLEVKKGLEMGADEYVQKPFTDEELMDAVQRCLNGRATAVE